MIKAGRTFCAAGFCSARFLFEEKSPEGFSGDLIYQTFSANRPFASAST